MISSYRLLNLALKPIHLLVVILVIIWWLAVKKRFVVIGLPLYSFAPLVWHTPYEIEAILNCNGRYKGKRIVVAFVGARYLVGNEWKLRRLKLHYGRELQLVTWTLLRLLYRFYRPGHSEDAIYNTLRSLQSQGGRLACLDGIANRSWSPPAPVTARAFIIQKRNTSQRIFALSQKERDFCRNKLIEQGWDASSGQRIISLVARDSLLRRNQHPVSRKVKKHARDMDLRVFVDAISFFVSAGYFVVRLGSQQEPVPFRHPCFWDYGALGEHREYLDFFIGSQSFACLSTGSGAETVCSLYQRPLGYVGFYGGFLSLDPVSDVATPIMLVPKRVRDLRSDTILSYSSAYGAPDVHRSLEKREGKYLTEDLTSDEMLEATTTFIQLLSDHSSFEAERALQREAFKSWPYARAQYPSSIFFSEFNPLIPPVFFELNQSWLLA